MICQLCRTLPKEIVVTDEHKRWWLERYSIEWICDTAEMIWGHEPVEDGQ